MMREKYFLPLLSPQHHETFRGLPGSDLPDTYDEWFKLHTKEKLERNQVGFDVVEIQVDPNEFVRYITPRGIAGDGLRLLHFADEKGRGNRY